MEKFAFISRHQPTERQQELALEKGIELVSIGDADAFSVNSSFVDSAGAFSGVVVVHPAAALRLAPHFLIGIFENARRPGPDEKPLFEAKEFHLYNLVD